MKKNKAQTIVVTFLAFFSVLAVSCGRPEDDASGSSNDTGSNSQNYMEVNGVAGFGTQCPYGSISSITPAPLEMYNCPIGLDHVDLDQNIEPLYISVDCKNKIISARTADHRIDTNWYALPDKTFFFTVDGLKARLRSDGRGGHVDCETPLSIDFFGTLQCDDTNAHRDQADFKFEAVMWTGRGSNNPNHHTPSPPATPLPNPTPGESPTPFPTPSGFPTSSAPTPTTTPTGNPAPTPSSTSNPFPWWPFPWPTSHPTSTPAPAPTHSSGDSSSGGGGWIWGDSLRSLSEREAITCSLPKSCYMYVNMDLKQCH
ncbi:MAG: hypothetical protein P4M08_00545 [Oligoflexia bacterium]|nr:hypothetical protein [Oligoflexia bacterium]